MVEAFLWRLKIYGGWVAAVIAVLLGWFHGWELLSKFISSQTAISIIANGYIVLLSACIIVIAGLRQWITIRKEKYANISPLIHSTLHEVRDLYTYIKNSEPTGGTPQQYEDFSNHCKIIFVRVLDQLNSIFTSITSTHCRTAIKLIYRVDQVLYVYTLARDQVSRHKCLRADNQRVKEITIHFTTTLNLLDYLVITRNVGTSFQTISRQITRSGRPV